MFRYKSATFRGTMPVLKTNFKILHVYDRTSRNAQSTLQLPSFCTRIGWEH